MPLCLHVAYVGYEYGLKSKIAYSSPKPSAENRRNRVVYTWLERKPDRYDYLPKL